MTAPEPTTPLAICPRCGAELAAVPDEASGGWLVPQHRAGFALCPGTYDPVEVSP